MSRHDSILTYAKSRYLWISLVLMGGSLAAYVWHDPGGPPNGGTWLGYTLGTIGALLIVWLMFFGVRKRHYMTSPGTLRGWLSAHIYLGTSLILIVLLHAGFAVGWNLHTFTFVLMLIVIFSGFFGMYVYLRYPDADDAQPRERDARCDARGNRRDRPERAGAGRRHRSENPRHRPAFDREHQARRRRLDATARARWLRSRADFAARRRSKCARSSSETPTGELPTMFAMVDFLAGTAIDKQSEALRKLIDMISRKKGLATQGRARHPVSGDDGDLAVHSCADFVRAVGCPDRAYRLVVFLLVISDVTSDLFASNDSPRSMASGESWSPARLSATCNRKRKLPLACGERVSFLCLCKEK